jgi:iron-sulfur cluster assembly 2
MSSTARTISRTLISHGVHHRISTPARRSLFSMIRLERLQTFLTTSEYPSFTNNNGWQQQRRMVMVTKTKSAELATEERSLKEAPGESSTAECTVLSEDLIFTPSCLARVNKLIHIRKSKGGEDPFLRVFVDAGGCSGFQYQFEIDDKFDPEQDITLVATATNGKPRIVVDETSLGFLKGSTLDYIQELARSAFVIAHNPQSESACGCGSSFAVKNFSANPALD